MCTDRLIRGLFMLTVLVSVSAVAQQPIQQIEPESVPLVIAQAQTTTQESTDALPESVQDELQPRPELGARLLSDMSEQAQSIRRQELIATSHRVMPSMSREQKQQIYNSMVSASGMSMLELFNFMTAKKQVADEISFDEVIESMEIKANDVNFKKVGHSKIWQDVSAISGLPALRVEVLQFCDAIVGRRMLDFSPEFAIFIPCRITVMEDATGDIWIMTLDWDATWLSMAWHPDSQLTDQLKEDAIRIRDAMEQIMHAGATGQW